MAANFEKLGALVVLEKNGTDSYKLKDTQFGKILNQINNQRFTDAYGSALEPIDVSAGSTTYTKNVGGTLNDKTALGGGTPEKMKLDPITIYLKHNKYLNQGITAIDEKRGLSEAAGKKLALFMGQLEMDNQEVAYTFIKADTTHTTKVDYTAADMVGAKSSAFRNLLVSEATKMLRTKDVDQGILRIRKDEILIDLSPESFALAIEGAVTGDLASQIVQEGIFSFVTLGGFKVRSNPYLDAGTAVGDMPAIFTTNYVFKSPMSFTAMNVDRLLPSNDKAVYTEANYGEGFVYTGIMKKIILK